MITALITRPDRLVIAVAALLWVWMLGEAAVAQRISCCGPFPTKASDVSSWMVMVGAMMLPTTTPAVRDVATRSYRSRRSRVVLEYLSGYMACWLLAGAVFACVRICPLAHDLRTAATFCLLAAAWAILPVRALWFVCCHRQIPLCPSGPRADLDAFRQGAIHGIPCIKMCWPLMFACAITGHDLVVMIGGTVLAIAEKRMFRLNRKPLVIGSFALAGWICVRWLLFNTNEFIHWAGYGIAVNAR
jgi:predicted metal-binding membrane protein